MQILIAVSINTRAHAEPGAEPITETAPESPESETAAKPGSEKVSRSPKPRNDDRPSFYGMLRWQG